MTEFAVWAPSVWRARLQVLESTVEMAPAGRGWWHATVPAARAGTDYAFLLGDDEDPLPDPRSPWQPYGVAGPSRVYDHDAFAWHDADWAGRGLPGKVLYELHVGRFTPEGTFDAAIAHLDHLRDLGVDVVELLPVNASGREDPGRVEELCWYAPHEPYGGPDGLKRLVDACHTRELGVLLDVPYHRLGLTEATWGPGVRLDGPNGDELRRYLIDGLLTWLREYHLDGLRLDPVHGLADKRLRHLLEQLAGEVAALSTVVGRPLSLIAGTELAGAPAAPAADLDELGDFGRLEGLGGVLRGALRRTGTPVPDRRAVTRPGRPEPDVGRRFVAYRHRDAPADHPSGAGVPYGLLRVGATLLLAGPFTPTLYMGEEWAAASSPRPGGTDLAEPIPAQRSPRPRWPGAEPPAAGPGRSVPRVKLDWTESGRPGHAQMLAFYRRLLALRRSEQDLFQPSPERIQVWYGDRYLAIRRGGCAVVANLAPVRQRINPYGTVRRVLLSTEPGLHLARDGVELPAQSAAVLSYR